MKHSVVLVDAFANRPFSGNPAAVCLLDAPSDAAWMQAVAGELNLPATAFVWSVGAEFSLRWFTASSELSLCGHGTLAAARVLFDLGPLEARQISFQTVAGSLGARQVGELIEMDFPAEVSSEADAPAELVRALGVPPTRVERNRLDYLVELESEQAVQMLRPDFMALRQVETRGVIVTARGTGDADFVSRFFAPGSGLDEDHVTGSAHCCLGPYWQRRYGVSTLKGRQLSRRGGVVHVQVDGDRVRLGGMALVVAHMEFSPEILSERSGEPLG
ncbi:MAG: PhzF family phenazine biosynthesis protein [Chloroflexi bacterium]|nr:PhzF family phenazine biosynthesis protein [Chloroflexota bacterium]